LVAIRSVEASITMATSPKSPDESRAEFVAAAQVALDETLQSGEGFDAKEVHDYLRAKVSGKTSAQPRAKSRRG
jgi:hypothetical protein